MKLKELQIQIKNQSEAQHITLAMLSNITFEPYFQLLINKSFKESHICVKVIPVDYSEFLSGVTTAQIDGTDIIAVIPNFEIFYPEMNNKDLNSDEIQALIDAEILNMKQICSVIRSKSNALIIWFGYEDYCYKVYSTIGNTVVQNGLVDKLNIQIFNHMESDIVYVDMKRMIANIGIANAYDNKNKYRWNSLYSQTMVEQICNEIHKQCLIAHGITKKCLVLDCDNVLWGGILSEDGIENIHLGSSGLGRFYQDFQRYLLFLHNHGVTLTVCSKNDMSDVMRMFCEHSEMILKEEHIACFQVNWNNKADNIRRISKILNIGLDSMVFIDDSDFEIKSVKHLLPKVTVIKYERDTIYDQLSCFNMDSIVDAESIRQRNNTYKTNEQRVKLKDNSKSFEDYLSELDMKIDIHPTLPIEYARIAELTQRTNKCTNGKRYTVAALKEKVEQSSYTLYSFSVSDKFSDLGLVGALGIGDAKLDLFSLSCRALGRKLEGKMLKFIADKHQIDKVDFKSTGKNEDIKTIILKVFPDSDLTNPEPD